MKAFTLQWRLLSMWLRNRQRLTTGLIVGITTAGLVLLYVALNSFALSGPQLADRSLGGHDYKVTTRLGAPGTNAAVPGEVSRGLASAGGADVTIQTVSYDFVVDGARTTGLATGLQSIVVYSQLESGALPSKLTVVSGRLPASPTEIAISGALSSLLESPTQVTVYAGRATLHVVGIIEDRYATDSLRVVGGPGLWQGLPQNVTDSFPSEATLQVSWNVLTPEVALPVVATLTDTPADQLETGLETRRHYFATSQRSLTARSPAMFTFPSLGLVVLAGLVMSSFVIARLKPEIRALARIGVPTRGTWQAAAATIAVLLTGSVVGGAVVGGVAGRALRLVIIPRLLTQPISPYPQLLGMVAQLLGAAIITGLVCLVAMSRPPSARRVGHSRWLAHGRHLAVAGLTVWCVIRAQTAQRIEDGLAIGAAVTAIGLLLLPDLVEATVGLIRGRSLDQRIAARLLQSQSGRITVVAVFLCACLALPCSLAILTASVQQSSAAQSVLPQGQLRLQDAAGHAPDPSIVEAVERETGLADPVSVRMLHGSLEGSGSNAFGVMVVDHISDLERLNGGPLDADTSRILESGGLLDFSGAEGDMTVAPDDASPVVLPTARVAFQPAWALSYGGAILDDTRENLNALQTDDSLVYTDVSDHQIAAATAAVQAAGGDPRIVSYHVTPPPSEIPWEWWTAIGALATIGLAATFIVARGIGTNLLQHSAQFLAIGLPPRTTRTVLVMQLATIIAVVLPLTLIVGIAPTAALAAASRKMSLYVPAGMLVSSMVCLVGVIAASSLGAIGGVRARDRAVSTLI